jgi:hypothetical protein
MYARKNHSGHVVVEWVMATFVLVMMLFAPLAGEDQSIAGVFMDSIRDFYSSTSLIYSLP